jgi:hypothetical protein
MDDAGAIGNWNNHQRWKCIMRIATQPDDSRKKPHSNEKWKFLHSTWTSQVSNDSACRVFVQRPENGTRTLSEQRIPSLGHQNDSGKAREMRESDGSRSL